MFVLLQNEILIEFGVNFDCDNEAKGRISRIDDDDSGLDIDGFLRSISFHSFFVSFVRFVEKKFLLFCSPKEFCFKLD